MQRGKQIRLALWLVVMGAAIAVFALLWTKGLLVGDSSGSADDNLRALADEEIATRRAMHIEQVADIYFQNQNGVDVTLEGLSYDNMSATGEQRPLLIFFGFTFCPDICPATLARISDWMVTLDEEFGREQNILQPVFITMDPARDTVEELANYLGYFDERIIGLTSNEEVVQDLVERWPIYYERVDLAGGEYLIDHSAGVFVFMPDGRLAGTLSYNESRDMVLEKLRQLLTLTLAH